MIPGIVEQAVAGTPGPVTDPYWANVEFLSGFEGADGSTSFLDESSLGKSIVAVGNAQLDTGIPLAGSSSLLLDGSGDYARVDDTAWDISNTDFTFEALIRLNAAKTTQAIASKRPSSGGGTEFWFYINNSNELAAQFLAGSVSRLNLSSGAVLSFALDTTYHVALTRSGDICRAFLDGIKVAEGTLSAEPGMGSNPLIIGRDPFNTSRDFNGWIDEVRVTKSVARYTGDFTVPDFPLPRG